VNTNAFGDLTNEVPYVNRVLDERTAVSMERGCPATSKGPAKIVAYYTPPHQV
jgi:hypothetical protein